MDLFLFAVAVFMVFGGITAMNIIPSGRLSNGRLVMTFLCATLARSLVERRN
mgnify:CR=1 FL=1|jgi:hypothetical protein